MKPAFGKHQLNIQHLPSELHAQAKVNGSVLMPATVNRVGSVLLRAILSFTAICLSSRVVAQSHGPCQIVYLVRDEKGEPLDPEKLDSIVSPKGEEMKAGVAFIKNPDDADLKEVKCLKSRLDIGGKPVVLSEMTLKYHGQAMRLRFDLSLVEEKRVIDSIPFQEGSFKLDKGKWGKVEN